MSYLLDYGYRIEAQVAIPLPEVSYTRGYDGALPWSRTGVVLEEGDVAVLEVIGTLDVRLHPELVDYACSWMIPPLERPNQCHLGADAVLETVGPDYYKEGWAAPVFRVGGSQLPLNFPFRGPGQIEMMRNGTWGPFWSRGILAPYHRYTGNQTVNIYVRRKQQPELTVRCTPNPVTRGNVIRCTAGKKADTPGELRITGWSFEGRARTDGNVTSTEWNGVMVKGGSVRVAGMIGEVRAKDAPIDIAVADRGWYDVLREPHISNDLCAIRTSTCLQTPPKEYQDLGKTRLPPFEYALPLANVSEGPNTHWWYITGDRGPVQLPQPITYLHPQVFDSGSDFYKTRNCIPARVQKWITEHESAHVSIGRTQLKNRPLNPWLDRRVAYSPNSAPDRWYHQSVRRIRDVTENLMDPAHREASSYSNAPCNLKLGSNSPASP